MCDRYFMERILSGDGQDVGTTREPVRQQYSDGLSVTCNLTSTMGPETAARITLSGTQKVESTVPKKRHDLLKWNGWGYSDSGFVGIEEKEVIRFIGNRYPIGNMDLPYFTDWVKSKFNIQNMNGRVFSKPLPNEEQLPKPIINVEFEEFLQSKQISFSRDGVDRLVRCHGHTAHDIMYLRQLDFSWLRLPDLVVWPECHDHVVAVVEEAKARDLVLIPFGGGTSVSWAVVCPKDERRLCVSVDTSQMNRLLWLDQENLVACFEAGIIGQDMERVLRSKGVTSGHEPDSLEFSSLGGWVATRASGMKKNTYGNIEDLLVSVRMVTPSGVLERRTQVPRMSCGPDFNHVILGSEGTLGVITEVAIKVRPLPVCKKYGSIVFPDFESGFRAVREVALKRLQPSSIRLMDNEQFKFGQCLRPVPSLFGLCLDGMKKAYLTKLKGFDVDKMCVTTLLFEGDPKEVALQEKRILEIAGRHGGISGGEKNGERGYTLTFVIAYIRDIALDFKIVAESFETSVSWDRALPLCRNVKHRVSEECRRRGILYFLISARVTQTYDAGCCIYFYLGFNYSTLEDPLQAYHEIEEAAREEILGVGGSLSHHHGVGKLRAKWYPQQVSQLGVSLYEHTKKQLDPTNVFANGNLFTPRKCHL